MIGISTFAAVEMIRNKHRHILIMYNSSNIVGTMYAILYE